MKKRFDHILALCGCQLDDFWCKGMTMFCKCLILNPILLSFSTFIFVILYILKYDINLWWIQMTSPYREFSVILLAICWQYWSINHHIGISNHHWKSISQLGIMELPDCLLLNLPIPQNIRGLLHIFVLGGVLWIWNRCMHCGICQIGQCVVGDEIR